MSQREVVIKGGSTNTSAKVTGQEELLVRVNSATPLPIIIPDAGSVKSPFIRRAAGAAATIDVKVYSISFSNVGSANATVSSDGGSVYETLKPGETISFDAGDINNYFEANTFAYDSTVVGAELLIIYVY